uniref:Receptor ligand binding region domain-containing protein n=1 Tax=Ditylenchus dipsaci TaxID=166011 RepID=A0A915DXF1_9BILA
MALTISVKSSQIESEEVTVKSRPVYFDGLASNKTFCAEIFAHFTIYCKRFDHQLLCSTVHHNYNGISGIVITNPPSNWLSSTAVPTSRIVSSTTTSSPKAIIQRNGTMNIKVGMMLPRNESAVSAFSNTASAVALAVDRIVSEKLLPTGTNISFSFVWKFEECVESTAIGYAFELIYEQQVDVLIAPPCIDGALLAGHVGTFYNIPVILWGPCFDSEFTRGDLFPTVMSVVPNYLDLGNVFCATLEWSVFSFQEDMQSVSNARTNCVIGYKDIVDSWRAEDIQYTLDQLKAKARIIVLCFDDNIQLRQFTLKLQEAGMDNSEYVYIIPDTDMRNDGLKDTPWWVSTLTPNDGRDADSLKIANKSFLLHVDTTSDAVDAFQNFSLEVMQRMKDWPFYCLDCNHGQDVNQSGISPSAYRNGEILTKSSNLQFEGMSGTVAMGRDGVRNALYFLSSYSDNNGTLQAFLTFQVTDEGVEASPN